MNPIKPKHLKLIRARHAFMKSANVAAGPSKAFCHCLRPTSQAVGSQGSVLFCGSIAPPPPPPPHPPPPTKKKNTPSTSKKIGLRFRTYRCGKPLPAGRSASIIWGFRVEACRGFDVGLTRGYGRVSGFRASTY